MEEETNYFRDLVKRMEDTDDKSDFVPMDPVVGMDVINDEFPNLNEDQSKMAFILATLADVEMGEEFVLRNGTPVRKSYEQYKIWRGLKGE